MRSHKSPGQKQKTITLSQPSWMPDGPLWELFSPGFRHTIQEVLAPAYRQFVLDVTDPIERSVGMTVVQLLWLEAWNHEQLVGSFAPSSDPLLMELAQPHERISRHLELVAAKCHATELLAKVRLLRQTLEARLSAPSATLLIAQSPSEPPTADTTSLSPC